MKSGSPFRLLQDYDSDDDNSEKDIQALIENLSPGTDSPSVTAGKSENVFSELSDGSLSSKALLLDNTTEDIESETTFIPTNKHIEDKNEQGTFVNPAADPEEKDDLGGAGGICDSGKFLKECEEKIANSSPVPYEVDEFGRYLRQGASDSDSDDSRRERRWKRGRSWSRSRSPADRRSPRKRREKRREKRGRSRSWSPRSRRRRSRSRTPTVRHADEFSGVNKRWGKGQSQACFDFVRGKCYRGASCRYLHNDSHNRDRSRRLGSKEYSEVSPDSKNYNTPKLSVHDDGKVKKQEKEHLQDMQGSFRGAGNDGNFPQEKEDCSGDAQHTSQERHSINSRTRESPSASGVAPEGPEAKIIQEETEQMNCHEAVQSPQPAFTGSFPGPSVSDADAPKSLDDTSIDAPAINSVIKPPVIEPSSVMSSSSQAYLSSTSTSQHHLSTQFSYQSAPEASHHPSQLKLPPPPPLLQGENMPHMPLTSSMPLKYAAEVMQRPPLLHLRPPSQLSQAGSVAHMAQTSFIPSQSVPRECFRPFIFPYQQSNFNMPPSSSWNSMPVLPPPPPPPVQPPSYAAAIVHPGIAAPSVTSQSQQSNLFPRNDSDAFLRRYPTQLPIRSQVNEFQRQVYPPMQENYHALSHAGDFRLNNLPAGNPPIHVQNLVQTSSVKNSLSMGSMHLQPTPEPRELSVNKVQPFTGDNLPPSELIKSSSHPHPYSQQQQLHAPTDSFLGPPDKVSSSHFHLNLPDVNHSSHLSDFGGSGIPTCYNPYASTFEQPLSSKLCPNEFRQENSCGLSHPSFDQKGLGSLQTTCPSTNSARTTGHIYPGTGKDQYDPLYDSIEPSSSSFKKSDHFQMQETTSDSNVLGFSGSNKPADVEENNKNKTGTISVTMSVDNEEFGETGDAEVGAVENGSSSDPIDSTDMNAGEVEIDQVKSSGKSKKNKDSRSMRVFKIALADFVKEVLKPSWRQGNMSKEAFKTIVKKTVEKVSRAMKKHQIPKSKPKIDQYIDSSQRKLTKLVMGYVDKYVKV